MIKGDVLTNGETVLYAEKIYEYETVIAVGFDGDVSIYHSYNNYEKLIKYFPAYEFVDIIERYNKLFS